MPNSVTANRPITRNRVCTKPGTVHYVRFLTPLSAAHKCRYVWEYEYRKSAGTALACSSVIDLDSLSRRQRLRTSTASRLHPVFRAHRGLRI